MRVALVAAPFIKIPPQFYGGTELFIAHLATGLEKLGHEVVIYATGDSEIPIEVRWLYAREQWPVKGDPSETLKEMNHTAWAIRDASEDCDIIHINNVFGLPYSRFVDTPFVYTLHHPHEEMLSGLYSHYPDVQYVSISAFQQRQESLPRLKTIHHGIDFSLYRFREKKQQYLSFLGRIAPMKGTHLAIQIAKKAGIPLKIAGEVQPMFRDYFEREVKPHVDGTFIEYIGEADLAAKNELLGNSLALLFPIQWDEPFGLVMIEAMACGTPVLALPGGSVQEIVQDGISGYVGKSTEQLQQYARNIETSIRPSIVRRYAEQQFSLERMTLEYERLYLANLGSKPLTVVNELLEISEEPSAA
jgi:glycosyltransferase involved in cell wall biosynthesis